MNTVSIDLYGNVFLNGTNTNRQIGDFARDPANYALGPEIDAAVRDAAIAGRAYIASKLSRVTALEAEITRLGGNPSAI